MTDNAQEILDQKLWNAVAQGEVRMAAHFAKVNGDLNQVDFDGDGLAHLAAMNGHTQMLEWLDNNGVDLNARNDYQNTPAHLAAIQGHPDVISYLCNQGYDVSSKNGDYQTPRDLARQHNQTRAGYLLRIIEEEPNTTASRIEHCLRDRIFSGKGAFYTDKGTINRNMIKKIKCKPTKFIYRALAGSGMLKDEGVKNALKSVFPKELAPLPKKYRPLNSGHEM